MKNRSLSVIVLFFLIISPCVIAQKIDIQVGTKATEWEFMDADKNPFTMDTWKGMVLQINYVDPDESDLNDEFNDLVKIAIDVDSIIHRDHFKGFGIVDCASSWKPNFLIRAVAGKKAKKYVLELRTLGVKAERVRYDGGDPGSLSKNDVHYIRKYIGFGG